MRKLRFLFVIIFALMNVTNVFATPYYNGMLNKYGGYSYTQDLYKPVATIDVKLTAPQDIYVDEKDDLYILEEKKLWVVNELETKQLLDENSLNKATGIFVSEGVIYIADKGDSTVKLFDNEGNLLESISKPTDTAFGSKSTYAPSKVAVNENGQIFLLSEGNTNGLVQLSTEGEFVGYFGGNNAKSSFFQKMKEKVLDGTELGKLIKVTPPSINNIDIDEKSIVYTTTIGNVDDPLKKLNIVGKDIYTYDPINGLESEVVDIATSEDFLYFLSSTYGEIFISSKDGEPIGLFGSKTGKTPVNGLFVNPIAIDTDSNKNIYVLDNTLLNVQVFSPTVYMSNIYDATILYKDGKYDESYDIFKSILVQTPNNITASKSLGLIERKYKNFDESLSYLKRANDKGNYSETFWEVRQEVINEYLVYVFGFIVLLTIWSVLYDKKLKHTALFKKLDDKYSKFKELSFIDNFIKLKKCMTKPNDVFYKIKISNSVTVLNTTIFFVLGVLILVISEHFTAYLFYEGYKEFISNSEIVIIGLSVYGLYLISNFLITSIFDGEGKFKEIYIGTVFAFAPFVLLTFVSALLSNVLTINEIFFIQLLGAVAIIWVVVLLLILNIEIHNYDFAESVKIFFITLVTMVILLVVIISLYTLFNQIIIFVMSLFKEVFSRV